METHFEEVVIGARYKWIEGGVSKRLSISFFLRITLWITPYEPIGVCQAWKSTKRLQQNPFSILLQAKMGGFNHDVPPFVVRPLLVNILGDIQ
ncbi:MAG: hypothetical protein Q8S73_42485 [Deltaproteobacteria bacterium]|nr:hypothetical protein [Deltaproteobacteria bacterium]